MTNSEYSKGTENTTISIWVKPETITAQQSYILGGKNYTNNYFALTSYLDVSNNVFYGSLGTFLNSNVTFTKKWYHIVITQNNLYCKIYVDGVLKNSLLAFNDITINGFDLGGITGYSNFFNGSISAMRIYNRAITSEEVALIYDFERN